MNPNETPPVAPRVVPAAAPKPSSPAVPPPVDNRADLALASVAAMRREVDALRERLNALEPPTDTVLARLRAAHVGSPNRVAFSKLREALDVSETSLALALFILEQRGEVAWLTRNQAAYGERWYWARTKAGAA